MAFVHYILEPEVQQYDRRSKNPKNVAVFSYVAAAVPVVSVDQLFLLTLLVEIQKN